MKFGRTATTIGVGSLMALAAAETRAQVLYQGDVNNAAGWTVDPGKGANSNAIFGFDYSSYGIPTPAGSTTPTAIRLEANTSSTGATQQGVTISPTAFGAQPLTGDYRIQAKVWLNTFGPFSGSASTGTGTTQLFGLGSGYTGGTNQRFGASAGGGSGTWFAVTVDGGSSGTSGTIRDYNAFTGSGAAAANFVTTAGAYSAGNQDSANAYYTAAFPSVNVPTVNNGDLATAQNAIASQIAGSTVTPQTGSITGVPLFAWRDYVIERAGNTVTFSIDGTPISTLTNATALDGGTSLTYFDPFASAAAYPALDFALVSSYTVTRIPEPSSLALAGVAAVGLLRRRRSVATA